MKNKYFTEQNVNNKSIELLDELINNVRCKKLNVTPEKSALLVLDMQEYFLNPNSHAYIPSAKAIISKLKELTSLFIKAKRPVIYTRHINSKENAAQMGTWWREIITEENSLSNICPELEAESLNATIINKTQYDAFYDTKLEDILREKEVSQIVITGVMTHLCCETTIRSAFMRGFVTFFPIDGTATYNENFHMASFLNLTHGFTVPVIIDEIKRDFEDALSVNH